jgi:hypothetical protein
VKKLKLVSLKIDDMHLFFNDGLNYIVGKNGTGKTTIFNCIKYALGLSKSSGISNIFRIDLKVRIDNVEMIFSRGVGDLSISISVEDIHHLFRPMSKELNSFLCEYLRPDYIFGREHESIFNLLDFFFLSNEHSVNRRQQWEAINSVCGINVALLGSLENDIYSLEKQVYGNKKIQNSIEEFVRLLLDKTNGLDECTDTNLCIESAKEEYFSKFRRDEILLIGATSKFEDIKNKSEHLLKCNLLEIEKVFIGIKKFTGYQQSALDDIESLVKGRNMNVSYSQEIFSRFTLVLAIAKVAQAMKFNFPSIVINDSYLSYNIEDKAHRGTVEILEDIAGEDKGLQYIEFTNRDDIPKQYIVLNLNSRENSNVFRGE